MTVTRTAVGPGLDEGPLPDATFYPEPDDMDLEAVIPYDPPLVARAPKPQPRAIESRAEIAGLESLHVERRQLMITLAPLKAVHGPFGMFDHRRKAFVETMKVRARMALVAAGTKTTEAMIDAEAHGDPQYLAFLDQMERDKIEYLNQQTRLDEIEEQIRSREVELLAYNSELRLAH